MRFYLYRFRNSLGRRILSQMLVVYLIVSVTSPAIFAQEQRRGMFLQNEATGQSGVDQLGGGQFESENSMDPMGTRRGAFTGVTYQVHVLGEVTRPGTYRITPSMRVTDALRMSGDIEQNGSERFIELRKPGQQTGRVVDLFAYKTLGELAQNPYLQDNDTVFVPLKQRAVEIEGPVRRPGVYELKNEKTLSDVVKLAGGFSVGASRKDPIKVIRYRGYEEKEIIEVPDSPEEMSNFHLQDGDFIVVQHKFLTKHQFDYNVRQLPNDNIFYPAYEDKVFVIGGVKAPGAFPFNQYYSLRQYLTLAGGTTTMAKPKKIHVVNVEGKATKAKNAEYAGVINPGDTIVVPEKSVPTQFYIGLLPTIASLGLSGVALFK